MFDNLLFQNSARLLEDDIKGARLPGAILFSGDEGSGKLTAALETARVLSCSEKPRGKWTCTCPSCLKNKALVSSNVMLLGPRDCSLEIQAARNAFVKSAASGDSHIAATRYLFLRAVRKLENRFNPILWEESDKLGKIAAVTGELDEALEELDVEHPLPEIKKVESGTEKIVELCQKLESDFLYDSIPILQIRNLSRWAHIGAADGTKVIIIERAERMLEGVRNALLKILEEPPADTLFILTTARRNAVLPTILSRVRTYNFTPRTEEQSEEIVSRVFHDTIISSEPSIQNYLLTFLPVSPAAVEQAAASFFDEVVSGKIPDIAALIKKCGKFEPRVLFRIFLSAVENSLRGFWNSAAGADASAQMATAVRKCYSNVSSYNQNIQAALEELVRTAAFINKSHSSVLGAAS